MDTIKDQPLRTFCHAVAQRSPAPGGGAVAGVAASLGMALGAMAARYTTGKRYPAVEAQALDLAEALDQAADRCHQLADEDAAAYHAVSTLRRDQADAQAIADAEAQARQIPLRIIRTCRQQSSSLAAFATDCNRWLLPDLRASLHLLHGAANAAFEILLAGQPVADEKTAALTDLQVIAEHCQGIGSIDLPELSSEA